MPGTGKHMTFFEKVASDLGLGGRFCRVQVSTCEKVASDLGLGGSFHRVHWFPPSVING